ncbi:MAG: hypothetical protein KatS3mg111_2495 [Pirellulaceae bacterium]|nr:MAG: hypothetical protein KatS3mg111_2495 [Pirellulaceae bacterium]
MGLTNRIPLPTNRWFVVMGWANTVGLAVRVFRRAPIDHECTMELSITLWQIVG